MSSPIKWMAENHVAANLLMMCFVVGGLVMAFTVKQEVFPEVNLDRIQVTVDYPGAAPEEVEEGIILQIEEAINGVRGIKEIHSVASEGRGVVTATIEVGENADLVLMDIKSEVDRITTFPEEAEEPVVAKMLNRREVLSLVVYGNVSEHALRERAEALRDELLAMPQITQTSLNGVRPYEISIEIPEENLRRYHLTLDRVAAMIRQASLDLPGGSVKALGGEVLIRTKERRTTGRGYEDIVLLVRKDGTEVTVGDIGTVKDGFAETDTYATFDGMPAVMVGVYRVGHQKPTEISKIVNEYARKKAAELPPTIHLATWNDTSELFDSRMKLLLKNAFLGLFLVFFILSLFLQMRLALWVMLGIPVSFLGALLMMPALDVSLNMISLFAFIMALGIVVDDAIVVGENIYEHRQKGKPYARAAVDGVRQVGGPVVFSVLTTVAAFLPLVYVEGTLGKFIKVIPVVVISILAVSLVESLFVLPAHLSLGRAIQRHAEAPNPYIRFRRRFTAALERFINGPYKRALCFCLDYRYATIASAIVILMLSVGMVKSGIVKFRFMPVVEGDKITAAITMPRGALVEETGRVQRRVLKAAYDTVAEIDAEVGDGSTVLRHAYSVVGGTIAKGGPAGADGTSGSHLSNVALLLTPSDFRDIPASHIADRWREKVGDVPGVESLTFSSNLMHMGANIDVQLSHEHFDLLEPAAERVKAYLRQYPGVTDIEDNYPPGKKELKITLRPEARMLGVTEESLGRQLRSAFYGAEALRFQRGRNEVKVMVRYPYEARRSLWDFRAMRIRTPDGGEMPLERAADVAMGRGYSEINRTDRKRVINITASVNPRLANAEEVIADLKATLLDSLADDYPGLQYQLEGEQKERRDSMGSMMRGFFLALFAIYALLAIPFKSYSQPLLIMAAIPFGVVGAILGHLMMGFDLSMLSIFGIVALSGVVVNDSLLLIDQTNQNVRAGASVPEAAVGAGVRRFRPIILTSVTTFLGLVPMILETSVQAQFLIPMAISLGFGIMFTTFLILFLVPTLYLALDDVHRLLAR